MKWVACLMIGLTAVLASPENPPPKRQQSKVRALCPDWPDPLYLANGKTLRHGLVHVRQVALKPHCRKP